MTANKKRKVTIKITECHSNVHDSKKGKRSELIQYIVFITIKFKINNSSITGFHLKFENYNFSFERVSLCREIYLGRLS